MTPTLPEIFQQEYCELRPRAPLPEFRLEFYRFANVNNTIRLREGRILVRISDLLETAPESVLRSIAHILSPSSTASPSHQRTPPAIGSTSRAII